MEEFTSELNKEEYFPSTLNKSINNYFKELNGIMDKFQIVLFNRDKDIINKLVEFEKNYKINCKNSLNNLTNLNIFLSILSNI
jgi:DNA-binding protein Fis